MNFQAIFKLYLILMCYGKNNLGFCKLVFMYAVAMLGAKNAKDPNLQ